MNLFIYCSGGFGREVMDICRRLNRTNETWTQISFLDDSRLESQHYGAEVLRFDAALEKCGPAGMQVVIANGEPFVRQALMKKVLTAGVQLASVIDRSAAISETAEIQAGVIIFPGCYVSSLVRIASNVALIANAAIGHDTTIGENSVVAGQVNVGGGCAIGANSYIGMGAQIKECTKVGVGSIVGMGSVVFSDIPDQVISLGNPCRPMRPNTNQRIFSR
jgi:sugar O-acyltransferase (sialic acid O-acetyltransferase NeuD family)